MISPKLQGSSFTKGRPRRGIRTACDVRLENTRHKVSNPYLNLTAIWGNRGQKDTLDRPPAYNLWKYSL